ncbi:MAG: hypothetical protein KatS3mg053_3195 [Candidatus Roseilinea sp.]|nr:MAG: hypothetical protein KatS3mg053_3195 [Candidatus Roseilinea sp.]
MTSPLDSHTRAADDGDLIQLAHDLIAAWNAHDPRRVASYFADAYTGDDVALAGRLHGRRDVRRYVAYNILGFPEFAR